MAAIYSNGGNRWNILGFNFTKRDALSSVYKISMTTTYFSSVGRDEQIPCLSIDSIHNLQAVVSLSFFVREYGIDFIQQPAIFGL